MPPPLGRSHSTIRRLRALRRDAARRRAERVFVAEGLHLAQEALASHAAVELLLSSPRLGGSEAGRRLLAEVERRGLPRAETSDSVLEQVQDARSPQPVLVLVRRAPRQLGRSIDALPPRPLVVVAHGLQDPGNLGGLLRSADAAGADALFTTGGGADLYHPRAVRASMGSIFRLPALAVELDALLEKLDGRGMAKVGAEPSAGRVYHASDLAGPTALFFGGEGAGLPAELRRVLDLELRIPLRPGVDSLSVGAAAAVLLFEAARQRTR